MANKHMKKCSTPWVIKEIQISTVMRYQYTHSMYKIRNSANNKYWWGSGITRTLIHCKWECKNYATTW